MSYRRLRSYKRLKSDTRYFVKKAGGEIKVKARITSRVGSRTYTTTEIGTSFASPIGDPDALRRAKEDALSDAITKHITDREDDIGPSGAIEGSGISTRRASQKRYGIKRVVILDSWVRHRVPRNQRVRREGDRMVWRNNKGQYITWNKVSSDSDSTRGNAELGYNEAFEGVDDEE